MISIDAELIANARGYIRQHGLTGNALDLMLKLIDRYEGAAFLSINSDNAVSAEYYKQKAVQAAKQLRKAIREPE